MTCLRMVSVQAETCGTHVKVTNRIKINLCCVRLNKCGLPKPQFVWRQNVGLPSPVSLKSYALREWRHNSNSVLLVTEGMSGGVDIVTNNSMLPVCSPVTTPPSGEPMTHFFHQSPEHCSISFAAINKMRQNTQVLYGQPHHITMTLPLSKNQSFATP